MGSDETRAANFLAQRHLLVTYWLSDLLADRRFFLTFAVALPMDSVPTAAQLPKPGPDAIVTAIYRRAAEGKGDTAGPFVWSDKAARPKFFSNASVVLWAQAEAKTPKGDAGPIDFDSVESRCGAVTVGRTYLFPPLSSGGASLARP